MQSAQNKPEPQRKLKLRKWIFDKNSFANTTTYTIHHLHPNIVYVVVTTVLVNTELQQVVFSSVLLLKEQQTSGHLEEKFFKR
jgi:hypothetical protein